MPDDLDMDALERFARDLRRIREDREVSLSTIEESTQIHGSHLRSFEAGTLYEKEKMTPVYLRAFVRAYAEALDLPPDQVAESLDASLSGTYQNELAVDYLNAPSSQLSEERWSEPSARSARDGEERDEPTSTENLASEGSSPSTPSAPSSTTEGARDTDEGSPATSPPSKRGASRSSTKETTASPGATSAQPRKGRSSAKSDGNGPVMLWPPRRRTLVLAGIGVILAVVVVAGITGLFSGGSGTASEPVPTSTPSASQAASGPDIPADTVETDSTEADSMAEPQPLADITFGDTLHVTVLATSDVRGLRVQQDDQLRRPYWIREGEAMVFPFARRITLENQLDSLRLLLEEYPYPTRTDDEGRVVITRDTAERYADTLRASPVPVPGSPDTSLGNAPPTEPES